MGLHAVNVRSGPRPGVGRSAPHYTVRGTFARNIQYPTAMLSDTLLGAMVLAIPCVCAAQPGTLDPTFVPGAVVGTPMCIAVQPDGRILVGGNFYTWDGAQHTLLARVNADGALDTSFPGGGNAGSYVASLALQPDVKILVGGEFSEYLGDPGNGIVRLNTDGSVDTGFDPGSGVSGLSIDVRGIVLQPDGKAVLCGNFTGYNGTPRNYIVRINGNGSLDATFNPGTGFDGATNAIQRQPDGKLLVAGEFNSFNGTTRHRIARLNTDGSLDPSFDPGTGPDDLVASMALLPSGKILIGGSFTQYSTIPCGHFARINAAGSYDFTYMVGTSANWHVYEILPQADGKCVIAGDFTAYSGTDCSYIARVDEYGLPDNTFEIGSAANDHVSAAALQPDGKILIGGPFTSYDGAARTHLARINGGDAIGFDEMEGEHRGPLIAPNPSDGLFAVRDMPNDVLFADVIAPDGRVVLHLSGPACRNLRVLDLGAQPTGCYSLVLGTAAQAYRETLVKTR